MFILPTLDAGHNVSEGKSVFSVGRRKQPPTLWEPRQDKRAAEKIYGAIKQIKGTQDLPFGATPTQTQQKEMRYGGDISQLGERDD